MLGITIFDLVFNEGITDVWNAVCKVRCSGYEYWTNVCQNVTTIASWNQSFVLNISSYELNLSTIFIDIEKCNTFQRNTPVGICTIDVKNCLNNEGVQNYPIFSTIGGELIGYILVEISAKSDVFLPSALNNSKEKEDCFGQEIYRLRIDILRLEGLPNRYINPYITCEFRNVRLRTEDIKSEDVSDSNSIKSYIFNQSFSFYAFNHGFASDSVILKLFGTESSLMSQCKQIAMGVFSYNLLKVQPISPVWFNLYSQAEGEKIFNGRLLLSAKCIKANQFSEPKIVAVPFYTLPPASQINGFLDLYRIITSFRDLNLTFEFKCGSFFKKISLNTNKDYINERIILPINLPVNKNNLDGFKSFYYLEFRVYSGATLIAYKSTKLKRFLSWQSFTIKGSDSKFQYLSMLMGVEMLTTGLSPPTRVRFVKRKYTYRLQIVRAQASAPTYLTGLRFNVSIAGTEKITSKIDSSAYNLLVLQTVIESKDVDVREFSNNTIMYICPINIQLVKYIDNKEIRYSGVLKPASDKFNGKIQLSGGWNVFVIFNLIPNGVVMPLWQPLYKVIDIDIDMHRVLLYTYKVNMDDLKYIFEIYGQVFEFKATVKKIKVKCNYPINIYRDDSKEIIGEKLNVTIVHVDKSVQLYNKSNLSFVIPIKGIEKICVPIAEEAISNIENDSTPGHNELHTSIAQGFETLPIGPDGVLHSLRGLYLKEDDSNVSIPNKLILITGIDKDRVELDSISDMETITPPPYDSANIYQVLDDSSTLKVGKAKFFITVKSKDSLIYGGKTFSEDNLQNSAGLGASDPLNLSLIVNRAICVPFMLEDVSIEFVLGNFKEIIKLNSKYAYGINLQINLFWQQIVIIANTPFLLINLVNPKAKLTGVVDLEDLFYSSSNTRSRVISLEGGGYLDIEYELIARDTTSSLTPPLTIKPTYELRLVVWSVLNVPNHPVDGFVGVKLYTPEYGGKYDKYQVTDIHYNCGGDAAIFNWRFVYPSISYPAHSCILQISFFNYKKINTSSVLGEYNWDLSPLFDKISVSGIGIQEDSTISLGSSKIQVSLYILNQSEANSNPVGLGRNEPNTNPKLFTPSQGRAWKDMILSAESSLGLSFGLDLSSFYLYIRIGSVLLSLIALIIIAFVYPAIFN